MTQSLENKTKTANYVDRNSHTPFASLGPLVEPITIGPSIAIKGDISGSEPLYIEGTVEGRLNFPEHRVTIGRRANVVADIHARELIVMGNLKGNVRCTEYAEIRTEATMTGDVLAQRVRIEEGAILRGSVEIQRVAEKKPDVSTSEAIETPKLALVEKPKAAAAAAGAGREATAVHGSSVLLEPKD